LLKELLDHLDAFITRQNMTTNDEAKEGVRDVALKVAHEVVLAIYDKKGAPDDLIIH
jgi:hypothetical protein